MPHATSYAATASWFKRYTALVNRAWFAAVLVACNPNVPDVMPRDAEPPLPLDGPPPCTQGELALAATTIAGCQQRGSADGARADARFNNPTNVLIAPDGAIYVTDFDNGLLRRIDADGTTSTMFAARTSTM